MDEERRAIAGYGDLYEITRSGRVFSKKANRMMKRCDDEYGFHIVKLSKNSKAINHNVFKLWKLAFPEVDEGEFRGALKVKYK
jgi:hypothetical protein